MEEPVENAGAHLGELSQQGVCGTVPDLLPHLDFGEYEGIYDKWCRGELSMEVLVRTYGKEVSEMVQVQYILSKDLDGDGSRNTQLDQTEVEVNKGDI